MGRNAAAWIGCVSVTDGWRGGIVGQRRAVIGANGCPVEGGEGEGERARAAAADGAVAAASGMDVVAGWETLPSPGHRLAATGARSIWCSTVQVGAERGKRLVRGWVGTEVSL